MDCQTLDEKLCELVEGTLDEAARAQADLHVAGCARCARELADYRSTVTLMAVTKHPPMPEEFWARQRERVMMVVRRALDARPWQAPPYSLAILLVIVAVYVFVGFDILGTVPDNAGGQQPSGSNVHLTLIPLYAFMLVLAGLTFRDRPDDAKSSGSGRS